MKSKHPNSFNLPSHPFWEFSLHVYSKPSVKEACLALQNRCGMNVNILLFCNWLGITGRGQLSKSDLEKSIAAIDNWHRTFTVGLRNIRSKLTSPSYGKIPLQKFRQSLLSQELAAEHIEQLILAGTITKPGNESLAVLRKLQDTIATLKAYIAIASHKFNDQDQQMVNQLLIEIFSNIPKGEVLQQCRLFSQ